MNVLKPWDNIIVEDSEEKFTVRLWGREYTFQNSVLPTSIKSQGEELLYEPMSLELEFNGEGDEIYNCNHRILESDDDKVVIGSSALSGNIIVSTTTTVEYDGYMDVVIRLAHCGSHRALHSQRMEKNLTPLLNKAELHIKLNKKASNLFHFWPNTDTSIRVYGVMNSGAFADRELPFKPCLWTGNENYGLNICMESDKDIEIADKSKCIVTEAKDEYNEITIHLLDQIPKAWQGHKERWLAPLEPLSYDVIFEATPVKKPSPQFENNWRTFQVYNMDVDVDLLHEQGVKWVIFHEEWGLIQNYWIARDEEKLREAVRKCHEYGMKVLLYFGYEYSSAMVDWEKNKEHFLNKDPEGQFTGGWTREKLYQKAFIACYNGGYSEGMINAVIKAMETYGADGIYTDGTYVPWECANELHGCGYRDIEGKLHITYPVKAVREHVKKLYTEVHKRGGVIDTHQSSCCMMPTQAFCDSYYDGEHIQGIFSEQLDKFLDLEAFRCEYMGTNFGIVPNFVTYLKPPHYTLRNVLSISLIHNVMARPGSRSILKELSKVWFAYDRLGIETAKKCMYWENTSSVKCENENIYITSFEKTDGIVVAVSKFSDVDKEEVLTVPAKFTTAYEIFEEKEYAVVDGRIECQIDATKAYMFEIR